MNIEEYRDYCLSMKGVTESTPFPKLPDILIFKVGGKMFTATSIDNFDFISIKCIPESVEELKLKYNAVQDPPYMNKKHWCKVIMNNSIPDNEIYGWLDTSYKLVVNKLPKKVREEIVS